MGTPRLHYTSLVNFRPTRSFYLPSIRWQIVGICAIGFGIVICPLRIAFSVQNPVNFLNSTFMQAMYVMVEVYFLLDTLYVEFRKGYYDEHTMDLVMDADLIHSVYWGKR